MSETLDRNEQSSLLEDLAQSLDIPPSKYREAVDHYQAVGRWLDATDSPLRRFVPSIYPQGSFRLGTVIRPIRDGKDSDYDIDLVCELGLRPNQISPGELKNLVGSRLKDHSTYRRILDREGRRCWTLQYAESDGIGFHLDALPAVSDSYAALADLRGRGVQHALADTAIAITHRERPAAAYAWVPGGSNPRGYATWFEAINRESFVRFSGVQKRLLHERNRVVFASVDDVPDALVRTPLQRVVQLLKRHRDVRFVGHNWETEKPISMILTTLAARAYRGEQLVREALEGIIGQIEGYSASQVIAREDGRWVVANPVNPGENFADRWNDAGSNRADAFFEWLRWLRQDLALLDDAGTAEQAKRLLEDSFSPRSASSSATASGALVPVSDAVPALADASHCQRPPWPQTQRYSVNVAGSVRRSEGAPKELWPLSSRPVPKSFSIRFHARTDVPPPYDVKWQVVNTGKEARDAGAHQLRGGFDDGSGQNGQVRWEQTAYRGTHWIEAFVVKDGICVARSGRTLVRVR